MRAVHGGPCLRAPCPQDKHRAGQHAGLSPGDPPGGPQHHWSPGQQGQRMCTSEAGQAGAQHPRGRGCPAGRSRGPGPTGWVRCRPAVAGGQNHAQPSCVAVPAEVGGRDVLHTEFCLPILNFSLLTHFVLNKLIYKHTQAVVFHWPSVVLLSLIPTPFEQMIMKRII